MIGDLPKISWYFSQTLSTEIITTMTNNQSALMVIVVINDKSVTFHNHFQKRSPQLLLQFVLP